MSEIQIQAVLARLSVTQFPRRVTDKKKTAEVLAAEHAAKDAGEWKKNLLPKSAMNGEASVLDAIGNVVGKARGLHMDLTSLWESPYAILPVKREPAYREGMKAAQAEFYRLVDLLPSVWPGYVEAARAAQGDLFNPNEYPDADTVVRKYSFEFGFCPVPAMNHFVEGLVEQSLAELREQVESQKAQRLTAVTEEVKQRILKPLADFASRLQDPGNRKFSSLLEHLRETCNNAEALNLTGNVELAQLVDVTRTLVTQLDNDTLKNEQLSGPVREVTQQILAKFGGVGVRKFAE